MKCAGAGGCGANTSDDTATLGWLLHRDHCNKATGLRWAKPCWGYEAIIVAPSAKASGFAAFGFLMVSPTAQKKSCQGVL